MSRDKEKKGFWKTFFRSSKRNRSAVPSAGRKSGAVTDVEDDGEGDSAIPRPRRLSDPESTTLRRNSSKFAQPYQSSPASQSPAALRKLHTYQNFEVTPTKGKDPGRFVNGLGSHPLGLSKTSAATRRRNSVWPPSGYRSDAELSLGHAMELICNGVPIFNGHIRPITHATDDYYETFATVSGTRGDTTDRVNQHDSMTQLMTMKKTGPGRATLPWATMEQPSYSFYFGRNPGTVTMNQWATTACARPPPIALRDSGVMPREVDLVRILGRLKDLEQGLEDDDIDYMYKNLYRRFLKDPDRVMSPHKSFDKQITDLILVLSRPGCWINFSLPKNQIVTRFIFDTGHVNDAQYLKFFHQLLLSTELDLRIQSTQHDQWTKEKLLETIPPAIRWNLALSRRWRENVRIEAYGSTANQVKLRFKPKRRQVKMIKRFAQMMKWPNLADTLAALRQSYETSSLNLISSHAMAFFSGLVLPGPSFPFIMMNALIDIDPDEATDDLALLIHLNPNCGFQYRNSYTYWTSTSIVGKVLAPTCHEVAGWVGPARPTLDLKRSQIARIRSRRPRQRLTSEDVRSMTERSDPLGPPDETYPISDYGLAIPTVHDLVDTVRIELLALKPCIERQADPGPKWFDASIQIAIDGVLWPLRLTYDVNFISAWPCADGPHPLFYDYTYLTVKADEIIAIRDWAKLYGSRSRADLNSKRSLGEQQQHDDSEQSAPDSPLGQCSSEARPRWDGFSNANENGASIGHANGDDKAHEHDEEEVLVIQAFGIPDNEVLARSWCAHWGLSAVVADSDRTWLVQRLPQHLKSGWARPRLQHMTDISIFSMACAIRQAYAAALTVVILVDENQDPCCKN